MSSVRKGLEQERDALAGMITATGHTPVRFEDFSAQNSPSRETCLRELGTCDVYLLLLGPNYGHTFPETGQSPTHEEWAFATRNGLERLVYRKADVEFEDKQQAFAREIEAYSSGVFRDSFSAAQELQEKVVVKLREVAERESVLDFEPLSEITVQWRDHSPQRGYFVAGTSRPLLEVHVIPTEPTSISTRVMTQYRESLIRKMREVGYVDATSALDVTYEDEVLTIRIPTIESGRHGEVRDGSLVGIRLLRSGQVSAWSTLPFNGMASVLDPDGLPTAISGMLRAIGSLDVVESRRIAIAVGVDPVQFVTVENFDANRPSASSMIIKHSDEPLRVEPDESVSQSAVSGGADEVSSHLARVLIDTWNRRR